MVFKSDKQRKKVMAELSKNQPRADTRPTFIGRLKAGQRTVSERLRKRFRPTAQEQIQERGARLAREGESLRQERIRTRQLELEARVEAQREDVLAREREARKRLSDIDRARRDRSVTGRAVARGKQLARTGLQKLKEAEARQPKPRARPRARARAEPAQEEGGFFGIDSEPTPRRGRGRRQTGNGGFFQV